MFKMLRESRIRFRDEPLVEAAFADTCFIAGSEHDPAPLWIECKCNPPGTAVGSETQFLHVSEGGPVQHIHVGAP